MQQRGSQRSKLWRNDAAPTNKTNRSIFVREEKFYRRPVGGSRMEGEEVVLVLSPATKKTALYMGRVPSGCWSRVSYFWCKDSTVPWYIYIYGNPQVVQIKPRNENKDRYWAPDRQALCCHLVPLWPAQHKPGLSKWACSGQAQSALDGSTVCIWLVPEDQS